jgi:hypothetical protein
LFFIFIGEFIKVVEERLVDGMDLRAGNWYVGEESFVASSEVGIFVIERDDPFVAEVNLPVRVRVRARAEIVWQKSAFIFRLGLKTSSENTKFHHSKPRHHAASHD